jgi:hypothetical protein
MLARAAETAIHPSPVRTPVRRAATGVRIVRPVAPVRVGAEAELDLAA